MAKIKYGATVAGASGTVGGTVFSHNRFGAYIRRWAMPVKSTTASAMAAKSRFSTASQAWAALTAAQRLAWGNWAAANPITDNMGETQNLDGHQAYVQINGRMLAASLTMLSTPPLAVAPAPLTSLSATFDVGSGTSVLTFAATPLGANKRLWVRAAKVDRSSINYIDNLLKFVGVTAANLATGYDYLATVEARLGACTAGEKLFLYVSVFDDLTGLLSPPLRVEGVITAAA